MLKIPFVLEGSRAVKCAAQCIPTSVLQCIVVFLGKSCILHLDTSRAKKSITRHGRPHDDVRPRTPEMSTKRVAGACRPQPNDQCIISATFKSAVEVLEHLRCPCGHARTKSKPGQPVHACCQPRHGFVVQLLFFFREAWFRCLHVFRFRA